MTRPALATTLAMLFFATAASRPPSRQVDPKAPLGGARGSYRVLLPPGYPQGGPYPVLYFLHDFFGDSGILWRQGSAEELTRRMASGAMPPLVLVAPDGGKSFWADFYSGRRRYETWLTESLRQEIEGRYRVRTDRRGRALAGISMGGYAALRTALKRPELYAQADSLSGALVPFDWSFITDTPWPLRLNLKRIFGRSPETNNLPANDLVTLLAREWPAGTARPRFELRCGTEDKYRLDEAARRFSEVAKKAGFDVELVLEPGTHSWSYWRRSVVEVVARQARAFAGGEQP
ncbi:MAG: alpha/beta hydrolase-fold protein [Thermoanaerobaculia bacterium]